MSKNNFRIIFMGTPDFAVPSLEILVREGFQVVAVITAPDKKAGRGKKLRPSAVKEAAEKYNLPVLQPTNLKDPVFLDELASYKADLQIVVAFRMLPEAVWNMPPKGTLNLHASLLPQYRGAAPINWAIINGETETGLTTFFLRHAIDTGDIIFREKELILPEDNAGSLHDKLMEKGAQLVLRTVNAILEGKHPVEVQPQADGNLKKASKIFTEDCFIKPELQTAPEVHNFVRGLSPYPSARLQIKNTVYKIFKTQVLENITTSDAKVGELTTNNKDFVHLYCKDNSLLAIEELQAPGKKRMPIQEFLKGNSLA
ncbi:MAG: methionyl-tRNA formyltransferase [Bernardetiaceae bacterium]|nr:methionyl-tRNA formyltransferase [Bernardetiaceae bacterium]